MHVDIMECTPIHIISNISYSIFVLITFLFCGLGISEVHCRLGRPRWHSLGDVKNSW